MYLKVILGVSALCIADVVAFPTAMYDMMSRSESTRPLEETVAAISSIKERGADHIRRTPGFNAAVQYVPNQGDHRFVPPNFAAGDQRGPCPGRWSSWKKMGNAETDVVS